LRRGQVAQAKQETAQALGPNPPAPACGRCPGVCTRGQASCPHGERGAPPFALAVRQQAARDPLQVPVDQHFRQGFRDVLASKAFFSLDRPCGGVAGARCPLIRQSSPRQVKICEPRQREYLCGVLRNPFIPSPSKASILRLQFIFFSRMFAAALPSVTRQPVFEIVQPQINPRAILSIIENVRTAICHDWADTGRA